MLFDTRICTLGEGPLWHPKRQQFFWVDIMEKRLLTPGHHWDMGEYVSAAGWLDHDHLLVATQSKLIRFNIESGAQEDVAPLEADTPVTRSNDGRADPQGGFWIGTMGIGLEPGAGALYRYYRGELRQIAAPISVPNATCFAPDGETAYFADTPTRKVWRIRLDAHGWPTGDWEVFLDLNADGLNPDGAVMDADGTLWLALWGVGRVDGFDATGAQVGRFELPSPQTTCPAFGGPDLNQLLVTSAAENLDAATRAQFPHAGATFLIETDLTGQAEHQVIL